ncbi:MAG: hypothetical protein ABI687_11020 [Flavitalea sp.]
MGTLKIVKENLFFLSRHNPLLFRLIKKIQEADQYSEARMNAAKQRRARQMIGYALAHSSFYRKAWQSVDEGKLLEGDLQSLPIIHKTDIRDHIHTIATAPVKFLKAAHTSGTSGTPLCVYRSPGSILREHAYTWYFRMTHGLRIGDPVISLRATLDRNTMHYYNKAENVLYLSTYLLSKKNIPVYAKLINQFRPKALYAFPSSSFMLSNLLQQEELKVNIPLIFTSSETLYPFQREKIEQTLNGRILDYYGNVERSIAYGQCPYGSYHEMPLYSINEFPEKGVITTALMNKSFPMIRYFVEDSFLMTDGVCECGKPITIKSIEGRFDNFVKCPDGTIVTGMSMAFRGINGLQYAQIIQEEIPSIQVNLVTSPVFQENDQEILLKQLRNRLGDSLNIVFNKVEEEQIIKTPGGKYTLVLSRLSK